MGLRANEDGLRQVGLPETHAATPCSGIRQNPLLGREILITDYAEDTEEGTPRTKWDSPESPKYDNALPVVGFARIPPPIGVFRSGIGFQLVAMTGKMPVPRTISSLRD